MLALSSDTALSLSHADFALPPRSAKHPASIVQNCLQEQQQEDIFGDAHEFDDV